MTPSFVPSPLPGRPRGVFGLLGDTLRRPGGRRGISGLTVVLLVAGIGMFAWPLYTDWLAHNRQGQLRSQFTSPSYVQEYLTGHIQVGQGLTELQIPSLNVDVLVVQGTTLAALRAGAGHYVDTPLPGAKGNVGIAGHRTTFGRPFNRLDELKPGQVVYLITPFGKFTYSVVPGSEVQDPSDQPDLNGDFHANPWIVDPNNYRVVAQTGILGAGHWLTLTTCNPKGSAAQRLILRLVLTHTEVLRPAPQPTGTGH
ncbi:MAG TPA: sortase [Mycobacteriales bacterium]|nr:sortase [Mycobacteriales bacterium]